MIFVLFIIISDFRVLPRFLMREVLYRYILITRSSRLRTNSHRHRIRTTRIFRRACLAFVIKACRQSRGRISFLPLRAVRHICTSRTTMELRRLVLLSRLLRVLRLNAVEQGSTCISTLTRCPLLTCLNRMFYRDGRNGLNFHLISAPRALTRGLLLRIRVEVLVNYEY